MYYRMSRICKWCTRVSPKKEIPTRGESGENSLVKLRSNAEMWIVFFLGGKPSGSSGLSGGHDRLSVVRITSGSIILICKLIPLPLREYRSAIDSGPYSHTTSTPYSVATHSPRRSRLTIQSKTNLSLPLHPLYPRRTPACRFLRAVSSIALFMPVC